MAQRVRPRPDAIEPIGERLDRSHPSVFEPTPGAGETREEVLAGDLTEATVLIVDARFESVRALTAALLEQGYRVCAADGGEAALAALPSQHPHVALVHADLLAAGDGDLVRRLRVHAPALPVIVVGPVLDAAPRRRLLRAHEVNGVYADGEAAERLGELVDAALSARRCAERACMDHEARSLLLAKLCHDLRSPLAVVQGYTELLQAGPVDSLLSEVLSNLAGATETAVALVHEYLELARLEAPGPDDGYMPVELDELVEDLQLAAVRQIGDRPLRLVARVPWTGGILYADARKLRATLVHLISNAIKFSGAGDIGLLVHSRRGRTEFLVADRGPGLADDPGAPLATPFRQRSGDGLATTPGQGVGLAVAKRLSALIGAVLTVKTRRNGGTVFRLSVPGALRAPAADTRGRTLH